MTPPLPETHPALAAQWHPARNEGLRPEDVTYGSGKKVWWKCPAGDAHEWEATPNTRTNMDAGCPVCANRKIVPSNSLRTLRPDLAAEWHPTKNGDLTPDDVAPGSHKRVWWECPEGEDHVWEQKLVTRTRQEVGCPVCANQKIVPSNSLRTLRPDLAAEWHPTKNGTLTPDDVGVGSGQKVWWKCPEGADHVWGAVVKDRVHGDGCPVCANQKIVPSNSLRTLRPDLAAEWHSTKNGDLTPDDVGPGSSKKVWWSCSAIDDHEWEATIDHRASRDQGCPHCTLWGRSKAEVRLAAELQLFFPSIDLSGPPVPDRGRWRHVDILIPRHGLVVEYDGAYYHEGCRDRDRRKTAWLKARGWTVIRARGAPLEPITPTDVVVPGGADIKTCADRVLETIVGVVGCELSGLEDYLAEEECQNTEVADAFLEDALEAAA